MKLILNKLSKALSFGLLFIWLIFWAYNAYTHFAPNSNLPNIHLIENRQRCDLQKTQCNFHLPSNSQFNVSFSAKNIKANQLTEIILEGEDKDYVPFAIDFNGSEMEMGYNRPALKKEKSGKYKGSFILPTCSTATFSWRAIILYKNNENEILGVPFYFEVSEN